MSNGKRGKGHPEVEGHDNGCDDPPSGEKTRMESATEERYIDIDTTMGMNYGRSIGYRTNPRSRTISRSARLRRRWWCYWTWTRSASWICTSTISRWGRDAR